MGVSFITISELYFCCIRFLKDHMHQREKKSIKMGTDGKR